MRRLEDCWLWQEKGHVRWLAASGTGTLPDESAVRLDTTFVTLGDPARTLALGHAAPAPIALLIRRLLAESGRIRLHLCRDLDESWQRVPYEWLNLDGARLYGRLAVSRYAPCLASRATPPTTATVVFADLWPESEADLHPLQDVVEEFGSNVLRLPGSQALTHFLGRHDPTACAALGVIAHGSEQPDASPFLDQGGRPWDLPLERGLPPLVLLLACGDGEGNLVRKGQALLGAGARTVLAPVGRIDPRSVREFLEGFLAQWLQGARADDALADIQALANPAAQALILLGEGGLRMASDAIADWPYEAVLAAVGRAEGTQELGAEALAELVNRITWRCYRQDGDLEGAVDGLYDALEMEYDDAPRERAVLRALDGGLQCVWPLALPWVLSYLSYLAESYDQRLLHRHRKEESKLAPNLPVAAYVYHHRAKSCYREGQYALAAQHLVHGFNALAPGRLCSRSGIGLLGQLVNVLIDLDLPQEGMVLYDVLDRCLARVSGKFAAVQGPNRLDRKARLELRAGQGSKALISYAQKMALDVARNPTRDLAWLLYASAWVDLDAAGGYVRETASALSAVPNRIEYWEDLTPAYVIRAYALWAWRSASEDAAAQLQVLNPILAAGLRKGRDPGPFALAVGYLHLFRQRGSDPTFELVPWAEAESALEVFGYWLELSALNALMGRLPGAARALDRFHRQRTDALAALPQWLAGERIGDWSERHAERSALERAVLLQPSPPMPEELAKSGLLPL